MKFKFALTVFLSVCLLLSFFCVLPVSAEAPWLADYSRRMLFQWPSVGQGNFTVLNQTGINAPNNFYIFNETQSDFKDLRLTLSDGETVVPIWN